MIIVAAGLIGIYIIFALITSHITEAFGTLLKQRGTTLYRGIVQLVGEDATLAQKTGIDKEAQQAGSALVDEMYRHPLLANLSSGKGKPSYIPARAFTLSFVDEFRKMYATDANGTALSPPDMLADPDALFNDLVARIQGLPDGTLKQTLTTIVQTTDRKYDAFLLAIDKMFDSTMQRVSGWYKRWTAVVVAVVALLLVGACNVDTLSIVRQLSQNQSQAQAYAAAAQNVTNEKDLGTLLGQVPPITFGSYKDVQKKQWGFKILGLLISWFAIMLGAPFWFDLLQRIVPVRLNGDIPAVKSIAPTGQDIADVQSASAAPADAS